LFEDVELMGDVRAKETYEKVFIINPAEKKFDIIYP